MSFSLLTSYGYFNVVVDPEQVGLLASGRKVAGGVTDLRISSDAEFELVDSVSPRSSLAELLTAWASGEYEALTEIPVIYPKSDFRVSVSIAMRQIPAGGVLSYAELAAAAGKPAAIRAAASVCARNPIPIVIPCHRIVRSDGSLGNYFYGTQMKDALLRHERFLQS